LSRKQTGGERLNVWSARRSSCRLAAFFSSPQMTGATAREHRDHLIVEVTAS
jgi:hypothetical protein